MTAFTHPKLIQDSPLSKLIDNMRLSQEGLSKKKQRKLDDSLAILLDELAGLMPVIDQKSTFGQEMFGFSLALALRSYYASTSKTIVNTPIDYLPKASLSNMFLFSSVSLGVEGVAFALGFGTLVLSSLILPPSIVTLPFMAILAVGALVSLSLVFTPIFSPIIKEVAHQTVKQLPKRKSALQGQSLFVKNVNIPSIKDSIASDHQGNTSQQQTHFSLDEINKALLLLGIDLKNPNGQFEDELKKQYRQKAKELHPDRTAHLTPEERTARQETFKEVNSAKELLERWYEAGMPSTDSKHQSSFRF